VGAGPWVVGLTAAAAADYRQILYWTLENFAGVQVRTYADTPLIGLKAIRTGSAIPGVEEPTGIRANIQMPHVVREDRNDRHLFALRVGNLRGRNVIDVLQLLHGSTNLKRHLPLAAIIERVPG
jgi:plasmid stabilization system protein ParE